jgi:hypothetical protein
LENELETTRPADEPVPPAEQPAEEGSDLDDLFGQLSDGAILVNSDDLPMRSWTDNTGLFKTRGRLVLIGSDFVRILKENSRHCTVPLGRLSRADLGYVVRVAHNRRESGLLRLASDRP